MNEVKNNLVLELHVPDFKKVKDFYYILGFKEIVYDPVTEDTLAYLVLKRDDPLGATILNFYGSSDKVVKHSHFKQFPVTTPRGYAVEITLTVNNIDQLWNEVKDKIPPEQISQPLELKPWNKKDFRITDPFEFYLRFTELVNWGQ